jgi:DNA-directed RNA polymerase III subunit RPC2
MADVAKGTDEELRAPVSRVEDKWKLVPAYLQVRGLVKQHIESFDNFIERELKSILLANNEIRSEVGL